MRAVWTPALLATLLGATAPAAAAPRGPAVELRAPLRAEPALRLLPDPVLRAIPDTTQPAGAYAEVSRWIARVSAPGPDGRARLVVLTVPGGLAVGWARRW